MADERATIETIAPNVEDAVARGLFELGLNEDEVDVEVLDEGRPGERDARVRLTARRAPGAAAETQAERTARETLQELLSKMKIRARVAAYWGESAEPGDEKPLVLNVRGDDLGQLIGRRGETLAALQYIVRVIVAKQMGAYLNVVVDVEGYKSRREQQLRQIAQRMAEQATARGRTVVLEPMPPNERRLIHVALRDHPGVRTESVGEGDNRKVTIVPKKQD
ncbi:MAG: protein jag [Chloroflexi bacterium]|nr:protein jag [Chloroflexota bacterium]MBI3763470.1 protein jag [Chloroflexota bacterium]